MEKYSWHKNRWFSLGTWWTSIPIIFICTVSVPRQLRLPCATVHRRSCKQNNWHFLGQAVSCPFLLLLQHHSAKFQSLQTFLLGFIRIVIMSKLLRPCLKSNVCVKSGACIVSPLHHENEPNGWIISCYLQGSFDFCNSLVSKIWKTALCSENRVFKGEKESMRGTKREVTVVSETGNFDPTLIVNVSMLSLCIILRERK